jgi:hypothetical protein
VLSALIFRALPTLHTQRIYGFDIILRIHRDYSLSSFNQFVFVTERHFALCGTGNVFSASSQRNFTEVLVKASPFRLVCAHVRFKITERILMKFGVTELSGSSGFG